MTFRNCSFRYLRAASIGGAVYVRALQSEQNLLFDGTLVVGFVNFEDCAFSDNEAPEGYQIHAEGSKLLRTDVGVAISLNA